MRWFAAQDTFSVDLKSGGSRTVTKGATLPETDAVVKQIGEGPLFLLVDPGEDAPAPRSRGRAAK